MRRSAPLFVGLAAGLLVFSACRDAAVAPPEHSSAVNDVGVPAVGFSELASSSTGITYRITLDPTRENVYSDGVTTIRIPARTICDPATSSYGPAFWDAPCAAATSPIGLTVTLSASDGGMIVHFGRDLRFAPSSDPSRQVMLVADVPKLKTSASPSSRFTVLWVPAADQKMVDEGATDPSLATIVNRSEGRLVRRLKHFSGYYVNLGFKECNPEEDTDCPPKEGE